MNSVVLINGKQQTKLNVFDRLVQFGDGLFETCLIEKKQILFWDKHWLRLKQGCNTLNITNISQDVWLEDIHQALALSKLTQAVVKIIHSRGQNTRGYGYKDNIKTTRIVIISALSDLPNEYQLNLCSSGYHHNQLLTGIKHCNRLEQILARTNMSADECIMIDENKHIISVTQANIFAINSGIILTPDLSQCGIQGTRRSIVFELATALKIPIKVCSLSIKQLFMANEVFITNSIIGIKPVISIENQQFNIHQITHQLIKEFNDLKAKQQ